MTSTPTSHDNPGVIAPPPLIFAAILAAGILADRFLVGASAGYPATARFIFSGVLIAAAGTFLAGALDLFRRARTRAEPWKPTTAIVTGGIYRFSRNPMYVGMELAYAGVVVLVGSLMALAFLPVALAVIHYGVILREERYLEAKFGAEYVRYKAGVRRWL